MCKWLGPGSSYTGVQGPVHLWSNKWVHTVHTQARKCSVARDLDTGQESQNWALEGQDICLFASVNLPNRQKSSQRQVSSSLNCPACPSREGSEGLSRGHLIKATWEPWLLEQGLSLHGGETSVGKLRRKWHLLLAAL